MIELVAAEQSSQLSQGGLLLLGLLSGGGVIGIIVKWLVASPEREAQAYRQGVADEQKRSDEEMAEMKVAMGKQTEEINKLRQGLLRLAVAADLNKEQRAEIAEALGYSRLPPSFPPAFLEDHHEPPLPTTDKKEGTNAE